MNFVLALFMFGPRKPVLQKLKHEYNTPLIAEQFVGICWELHTILTINNLHVGINKDFIFKLTSLVVQLHIILDPSKLTAVVSYLHCPYIHIKQFPILFQKQQQHKVYFYSPIVINILLSNSIYEIKNPKKSTLNIL